MNTSYRIGVDIGGTKVNAGILRPDGSILKKCLLSSGGAGNPRAFVDEICSSLRAMLDELNIPLSLVEHIGVGIPGTADSARGVVEYSCNLFGRNVPLGDYFEHALGRRVVVVQDSWAGAFAEHLFGAGRGHDDMMCVTIGTGIGCGVVLGGRVFGCAARSSLRMWKKSWRNALLPAALFCAAWCFLFRWPGAVPVTFIGITGAGLPELAVNLFSGRLLGALPAFFLSGALRILFTVFGISLFTVLYLDMGGRASLPLEALPSISARVDKAQRTAGRVWRRVQQSVLALWRKICGLPFIRRHKRLSAAVSAVLLFLFAGAVFALPAAPHVPIAIGHRGSASGVENTLEAIQGAIDAGADYAEIDVLLSKDGVPMVIHDTSLARLAGDSRNVYELTAAELQALTLEQNGCRGRISTLEEVLEYCKGKIGLLIELKTHGHETKDVARQAAQAVEAQQAADRCLFMSIDYSLVQAMNAIHPEYIIGYCVYGSVSSVDAAALLASGINFLTIEENMELAVAAGAPAQFFGVLRVRRIARRAACICVDCR